MASSDLGTVLESAVELLHALMRDVKTVPEARRLAAAWATKHSGVEVDLLVDQPPGGGRVEYDLLLTPSGGPTIAITVCGDKQTPWLVSYADHWAANFVVTVNGRHVSAQQVLREFALTTAQIPDLMEQVVRHVLEAQAMEPTDEEITQEELQQAVDLFRRQYGLETAADTVFWMEQRGITRAELGQLAASSIISRRIRNRVTQGHLESYFSIHRSDFDRITLTVVLASTVWDARSLAKKAREMGLLASIGTELTAARSAICQASVTTAFALDIDEKIRVPPPGEIVGPFQSVGGWMLAQVHRREPARLEGGTVEAVTNAVYQSWLQARRKAASVTWYWS